MSGRALALVAALSGAAHAGVEPVPTGALSSPSAATSPSHFGGDALVLTLYLRTDGSASAARKDAIAACLAALSRLPGAGLELYLDPEDRGSAPLADALLEIDGAGGRRALLGLLATRELPHWSDPNGYPRLLRATGLSSIRPRSTGAPPSVLRLAAHGPRRRGPDGASRAFLRRPPSLRSAGSSRCSIGERPIEPLTLDALAQSEDPLGGERPSAPSPAAPLGSALSRVVVTLRVDLGARPVMLKALDELDVLVRAGRVRLEIEPASNFPESLPLVRRALSVCDGDARRRLLEVLLHHPDTRDHATDAWLLTAAGIDPAGIAPASPPRDATMAELPILSIDGEPASTSSLRRVRGLPGVSGRLTPAPSP